MAKMTKEELHAQPVPKIHAQGRYDGELVMVAYHDRDAVWFRRLTNSGVFPIYLEDWPELQHRAEFPATNLAPYGTPLWG